MTDMWKVSLRVDMSVQGAESGDEAIESAKARLIEHIIAGGEVPFKSEVKRYYPERDEEPLFGRKLYE